MEKNSKRRSLTKTILFSLGRTKQGYFTGTYNGIAGKIKRISTGEVLYEISGKWSDELYITEKVSVVLPAGNSDRIVGQYESPIYFREMRADSALIMLWKIGREAGLL